MVRDAHVGDLACSRRLSTATGGHRVYNVGSGVGVSVREIIACQ
jgi:UDP-glucose 4-epimerase